MNLLFPRKIPTIPAFLLIIAIVAILNATWQYTVQTRTFASRSFEARDIQITNSTDTSFTVVWKTSDPASGTVVVSAKGGKPYSVFDDRDKGKVLGKFTIHHVTVRNVSPSTDYIITIYSNGRPYKSPTSIIARTGVTLEKTAEESSLEPAYGTAFTPENTPASGGVVFLTLPDSQTLSTFVQDTGSWVIPLSQIRTNDLSAYVSPDDRLDEHIIIAYDGDVADAETDTFNDSPVPAMTIGKSYDFRKIEVKNGLGSMLSYVPPASPTSGTGGANVLGEQTQQSASLKKKYTISISLPEENAKLITDFPMISGKGVPGKKISIVVGIKNPVSYDATIGEDALWRVTPTTPIPAGKQSVTITTTDITNKPVALTRLFEILKSGTQVLGIATPSGTLAPTPTLYLTPTISATSSPTPTYAVTPFETPTEEPPVTGFELPLQMLVIIGVCMLLSGTYLVFVWQ